MGEIFLSLRLINLPPATDQPPLGLVVALHGWGSNAQDLASLTPLLGLPSYQFIFPDAPFPHPQVPGGWMWYDFLDLTSQQGLRESRQRLQDWLQSLEAETGVPLSRTVLAGFSQGGAMTLDVGLGLPLAGLITLSGYLHPGALPTREEFPPVLMVHGRQDQVVPLRAAQSAREQLTGLGVALEYHEFEMGHEIQLPVIGLVRDFITRLVA